MAHLSHSQQVKEVLKKLLKKRGISYSDLAEELGCSLPTVKRIMSTEEISLTRLMQICRYLKVSLADLEKLAERWGSTDRIEYTLEQDQFLSANPDYLGYLTLLHNHRTPEQIREHFGLSERKNQKYLLQLEALELLKSPNGKVKLTHKELPQFPNAGTLYSRQMRNISETHQNFFLKHQRELLALKREGKSHPLNLSSHQSAGNQKVLPDTYRHYSKRVMTLLAEYYEQAEVDELTSRPSELVESVLYFHLVATDTENPDLDTFQEMFGKPKEAE